MNKIVVILALVLAISGMEAWAQMPRRSGATAVGPVRSAVALKKIDGIGNNGLVQTPEYSTSVNEPKYTGAGDKQWARVTVYFDTEPEWIDELTFKFYVLVRNAKTTQSTLFSGSVTFVDVSKGRLHPATMYLTPATVQRYGQVEAVAVEVVSGGEVVESLAVPDQPAQWWRSPKLKVKEGLLLNRAQTPFALINIDSYPPVKMR